MHLFRSFFKKKNGPTCVVHTCVAWRVAFLFSYSDVGEHVGVWEHGVPLTLMIWAGKKNSTEKNHIEND